MAKTTGKAGKRATATGRGGLRARKSGVAQAPNAKLRKPKPAKSEPRKAKPSPPSETASLKRQLKAARMQQEAGAEILRAVANTSGNVAGPLQQIAETTARLFNASSVAIQLAEGSEFTQEYRVGAIAKRVGSAYPRSNIKVGGRNLPGTVVAESRQIHIPDLDHLDPSMSDFPGLPHARAGGARTVCGTPLRREGKAIGALIVLRDRLLPFTDDELALQQSFADQAVIAIENTRLFNETRQALERQAATSDILRIISQSPTDVQPVFDAIVLTAVRLFKRDRSFILRCDSATYWPVALAGPDGLLPFPDLAPEPIDRDANFPSRAIVTGKNLHLPDWAAIDLPEYERRIRDTFGFNSALYLPLLQGGKCIGILGIAGTRAGSFKDDEIALAESFRDQALIAIENTRLFNETREALERQTASADILKVIASSPSDVQPVFNALVLTARRLLGREMAGILLCGEDATFRAVAGAGPDGLIPIDPILAARTKIDPEANFPSRAIVSKENLHLPDWSAIDLPEQERNMREMIGWNSTLYLPMLRGEECIGVLLLGGKQPGIFSEADIALAESFRDQAVIAIENTRLFNEAQAKTRDLSESLQQQTATADVLKVISRSAFDLQAVLTTLVRSALDLCNAPIGTFFLREGNVLRLASQVGCTAELVQYFYDNPIPLNQSSGAGRAFSTGRVVHFPDVLADPDYRLSEVQRLGDYRSLLAVPLLLEHETIGVFSLSRTRAEPFSQRQIDLVQTFADQAVIAIQNTRLFNETREALERQTATSDILNVIASSPTDTQPVFDAIARSAAELCEATNSGVFRLRDGLVHFVGHHNLSPEQLAFAPKAFPAPPHRGFMAGRAIIDRAVAHVPDIAADPEYSAESMVKAGFRSALSVPMLRNGEPIGAINVTREEARPFSDAQVELLKSFADQAVIAIENARLFEEVQAKTADLQESLEQQTATADVLKVISRSAFDLDAVMHTLARSAAELCAAGLCGLYIREGGFLVCRGYTTINKEQEEFVRQARIPVDDTKFVLSRVLSSGEIANIGDFENDSTVATRAFQQILGFKALLVVPLMREGHSIGLFVLGRDRVGDFSPRHVELVQTFADQAVIAIENARLFKEVQARTRDLAESLEHQTATSEVLQAIGGSMADTQPVFERILDSTHRLFDCKQSGIFLAPGDGLMHLAAGRGAGSELLGRVYPRPIHDTMAFRVLGEGRQAYFADVMNDAGVSPSLRQTAQVIGNFSIVVTPMIWEGQGIGMISVLREPNAAFTPKELGLLETFADQAVIAIENARLFEETQEALERQTATADILKIISRSVAHAAPVFDTILESCQRLFNPYDAAVYLVEGDRVRGVAQRGAGAGDWGGDSMPLEGSSTGVAIAQRQPVHFPDLADKADLPEDKRAAVQETGGMTVLYAPMISQDSGVGSLVITRRPKKPFTKTEIGLIQTFADQAVIAIENARLFDEVQARTRDLSESLQQQTATADVLKVISRSAFDLNSVMNTLTRSAAELCKAELSALYLRDGDLMIARGMAGVDGARMDFLRNTPLRIDSSGAGRALQTGSILNMADVERDGTETTRKFGETLGFNSILFVPLMREGGSIGVFALGRKRTGEYSQREVELLQTFADQAVIAIENVRLFDEVQARTRELSKSLDDLRTAQDRLVQTEKLASLGQLTAGIAHEIKNPLNFVNNFSALSAELIDEMTEIFENPALDEAGRRKELDEIRGLLKSNLEKIVQHGKRADSIVKNMLLHSRESSGERRASDLNALVSESLSLAYHGARAERSDFNITLEQDFDPDAGTVEVYPQELTRALLNLISNGFYAATRRKVEADGETFEPVLSAVTRNAGEAVEIRIRDNGTGIPPEIREKIFNPFFTTKPTGEGTGLGLSMSHDIIVKQHGGSIDVETEPGAFTEFRIVLPRTNQR